MGKFTAAEDDIFSVFASGAWRSELIETQPSNYISPQAWTTYIRVSVLANGPGVNKMSVSGMLIIDIFTPSGDGPRPASVIADKLEQYLAFKSLQTVEGCTTQFQGGSLTPIGTDKANATLFRSSYTIPFKYYGVS
jgi:hypothetical protein